MSHSAYFIFTTRQAMYVPRNNEMHLCNHCCSRKAIIIIYSESVRLKPQLPSMQCARSKQPPVNFQAVLYFFTQYLINGTIFEGERERKKEVTAYQMFVLIFFIIVYETSHSKNSVCRHFPLSSTPKNISVTGTVSILW